MASTAVNSLAEPINQLLAVVEKRVRAALALGRAERSREVDAILSRIKDETKNILGYLLKELNRQALADPRFADAARRLRLLDSDIKTDMFNRFGFDPSGLNTVEANAGLCPSLIGGVAAGIGAGAVAATLSGGAAPVTVTAIAIAVAAIVFFIIKRHYDTQNGGAGESVDAYMANLKKTIYEWLDAVEKEYWERVEKI